MDQEDAEEMFRRLNNGKSLTAIELTRANAISGEKIRKIGNHNLFNIAMSEKSLASYANEDVVIKTWILLYSDKKSFETRYVRPVLKDTVITDEQVDEINKIYDLLLDLYEKLADKKQTKIIKKMFNKTNLISLVSVFKEGKDKEICIDEMEEWMVRFYDTGTKEMSLNDEYNEIVKGRIAVTENAVVSRKNILLNNFKEFIKA
jgi:hypothetical protein